MLLCTLWVTPQPNQLVWLRPGKVPKAALGSIAASLKAFSRARHHVRVRCTCNIMEAPLWHSCLFSISYGHTHFNTKLIKAGVVKFKHLFNLAGQPHQHVIKYLPASWHSIYTNGFHTFAKSPLNDWCVPSVWPATWAKAHSLSLIAPSLRVKDHVSSDMWRVF